MPPKFAEIKLNYSCISVDIEKLIGVLHNKIPILLGDDYSFHGSIDEAGSIKIRHTFESYDDLGELRSIPITFLSIHSYSKLSERSCTIYMASSSDVDINIQIEKSEIPFAYDWGKELASDMGFQEGSVFREKRYKAERTYAFRRAGQLNRLIEIINWLIEQLPAKSDYFRANYKLPEVDYEVYDLDEWKQALQENWEKIERSRISVDARSTDLSATFDGNEEQLRIRMESHNQSEIGVFFNKLENTFQLEKFVQENPKLIGQKRSFFLEANSTPDWLKLLIDTLQEILPKTIYFVGRYTLKSSPTQEARRENVLTWKTETIQLWDQLSKIYLRLDQRTRIVDIYFDPLRDIIDITIDARDQTEIDKMFDFLATKLKLELITEEPYRYRKSSGTYVIKGWRNERFSDAVKDVLKLFIGPKYDLVNAFIEMEPEKNSELQYFDSAEKFLEQTGKPQKYANAEIYVQAPKGLALSIETSEHHNKLWIGSTFSPDEFSQIEELFTRKLSLEKISSKIEDKSKEESSEKSKVWTEVMKIVITAAVTFLLSSLFWTNIFPKYALQITLPQIADGQTRRFQTQEANQIIHLEWTLTKEQWFRSEIDRNSLASIRIIKDGIEPLDLIPHQKPGAAIELEPGSYIIEVVSEISNQDDRVSIEVVSP